VATLPLAPLRCGGGEAMSSSSSWWWAGSRVSHRIGHFASSRARDPAHMPCMRARALSFGGSFRGERFVASRRPVTMTAVGNASKEHHPWHLKSCELDLEIAVGPYEGHEFHIFSAKIRKATLVACNSSWAPKLGAGLFRHWTRLFSLEGRSRFNDRY